MQRRFSVGLRAEKKLVIHDDDVDGDYLVSTTPVTLGRSILSFEIRSRCSKCRMLAFLRRRRCCIARHKRRALSLHHSSMLSSQMNEGFERIKKYCIQYPYLPWVMRIGVKRRIVIVATP